MSSLQDAIYIAITFRGKIKVKITGQDIMNHDCAVFYQSKQTHASTPWTAFMYHHPEAPYAELSLGGKQRRLVVWLFGMEWTTLPINLHLDQWHSLCLTWSHMKDKPALYVNRKLLEIKAGGLNNR